MSQLDELFDRYVEVYNDIDYSPSHYGTPFAVNDEMDRRLGNSFIKKFQTPLKSFKIFN